MSGCRLALPVIAILAFVSLGLPDGVLGVAWPSLRRTFGLPVGHLGLLLLTSMLGYLASTSSTGLLVARLGVGRLLLWSSAAVALAALGIALAPGWWVIVACGVLGGLGAGAVDAGVNAFAAQRFAPRMVSWLHASYGVGAMLGPLLMTAAIMHGPGWRAGYAAVGVALGAMAVCFALTLGRWRADENEEAESAGGSLGDTLRRRAVWANVAVFFVYTGLEVSSGQWAYSFLTEARSIDVATAGLAVGVFWGSLTAGRLACGALGDRVGAPRILRGAVLAAPAAATALWLAEGPALALLAIAALGASLAPVFPLMVSLTPGRVGAAHATHAIGLQVAAAYLGAATLPAAAGALAGAHGLWIVAPFLVGVAGTLRALHETTLRGPASGPGLTAMAAAEMVGPGGAVDPGRPSPVRGAPPRLTT